MNQNQDNNSNQSMNEGATENIKDFGSTEIKIQRKYSLSYNRRGN